MKVLVLGASGLLGHTFYRRWSKRSGWSLQGTYRSFPVAGLEKLDLLESGAAESWVSAAHPDVVVVPASNPNVDDCERNPEATRRLNVDATLAAAKATMQAGGKFIFFSSDYVFDGKTGGYREADAPSPLNEYGRQKLAVERALAAYGDRALVLRVSGLFGWEFRPKNFVHQVLSRLRKHEKARAVVDQEYNPTYVEYLADAVPALVEKGVSGLLHLAGADRMTRLEFARAAAEAFGFAADDVQGVPTSEFAGADSATRPEHSSLNADKAAKILGAPLAGARAGLKAMAAAQNEWDGYAAGLQPGEGVSR